MLQDHARHLMHVRVSREVRPAVNILAIKGSVLLASGFPIRVPWTFPFPADVRPPPACRSPARNRASKTNWRRDAVAERLRENHFGSVLGIDPQDDNPGWGLLSRHAEVGSSIWGVAGEFQ